MLGAKNVKAVAVRPRTKVAPADPAGVLAAAKDLRTRSFGAATAKYRELGTLANLLAFNALSTLPTRNFQAATFDGAPALAAEELAELRGTARNSCASCTIGCEHIYQLSTRRGGRTMRVEYENVFALGPMCGVSDPDDVLEASARCDDLGIDTISAGGTIAWAMECAEKGLLDAPWLRFGDGAALLRALDEIGSRHRAGAAARAGLAAGRGRGRPGLGRLRPARQGSRAARLRAPVAARDGARPGRQRPRRRPQPVRRLRGRPRAATSTGSTAGRRTSPRPSRPRTGPR